MGTGLKLSVLAICCIFKAIINNCTEFPRHVVDSLPAGILKLLDPAKGGDVMVQAEGMCLMWGLVADLCSVEDHKDLKAGDQMAWSYLLSNPRLLPHPPLSFDTNIHFAFNLESFCSVSMGIWQCRSLTISGCQKNSNFSCIL